MMKWFCNHCEKEIEDKNDRVAIEISIMRGLPRCQRSVDFHIDCVDKAFGEGFVANVLLEAEQKKKRAEERKLEKEKEQKEPTAAYRRITRA